MDWPTTAAEVLGLEGWSAKEQRLILDLTKDVAHAGERWHAPLTAYLMGLAVGAATVTDEGVAPADERLDRVRALCEALATAVESEDSA